TDPLTDREKRHDQGCEQEPASRPRHRRPKAPHRLHVRGEGFDEIGCRNHGSLRSPRIFRRFFTARCTLTLSEATDMPLADEASFSDISLSLSSCTALRCMGGSSSIACSSSCRSGL